MAQPFRRPLNVLLIGPPGAGKGTQGERLAQRLSLAHIATGDLLRAEVRAGTQLGRAAADIMRRGELVPDEVIIAMVLPRITEAAQGDGYLLDGFPRTLQQSEEVRRLADTDLVAPHAVFYLDVPRDELVRRILARAEVDGRSDDNERTVQTRLQVFDDATQPLVEHYRERGILRVVDADRDADAVTADLIAVLETVRG
jgi:adenylate kinase